MTDGRASPGGIDIALALDEGPVVMESVSRDMGNPPWEEARCRILIARLSPWKDVGPSISHLVLFDETRRELPDAYIDFAFFPSKHDRETLSDASVPWFFGRESGRSPAAFDLVMVSNAFALELLNLPYLFSSSGMPVSARERLDLDGLPVVIAGGSNASAMGAVADFGGGSAGIASDSIPDGIFFGEGEGKIGKLARILACPDNPGGKAPRSASDATDGGDSRHAASRRAALLRAASVPGFWPCFLAPGPRKTLADGRPANLTSPIVLNGPQASTVKLTASSGCPAFCSFCLEGWDRRPYAEGATERLLEEARRLRRESGAERVEVFSYSFNAHSGIFGLILGLSRIFMHVGLMSQRLDLLGGTRGLMEAELASGKKSFTFGIEGISGRMRSFFRKGFVSRDLMEYLSPVFVGETRELKLSFIISGFETPEDCEEFGLLMKEIAGKKRVAAPGLRIVASAGYLVRLPFTPLQYAAWSLDVGKLDAVREMMDSACRRSGIEFRLASPTEDYLCDQILSLGGSPLFTWLRDIPSLGSVFDGTVTEGTWNSIRGHLQEKGIRPDSLAEEKPADYRPPFAFLEPEAHHETLYNHYMEASSFRDRPPCLGGRCSGCGACDDGRQVRLMTEHRFLHPSQPRYGDMMRAISKAKRSFATVRLAADFPASLALACDEYRASRLLRDISRIAPGAERHVFFARELLFAEGTPYSGLCGKTGRWGWSLFGLSGPDAGELSRIVSVLESRAVSPGDEGIQYRAVPDRESPARRVCLETRIPGLESAAARAIFEEFLARAGLSHTTLCAETGYIFKFRESSEGKKFLFAASLRDSAEGLVVSMEAGQKAAIESLASGLSAAAGFRASIRVTDVLEEGN